MEDTQEALKMEDKKNQKKRTHSQSCFCKSKENQSEIVGAQDEPVFEKNVLLLDNIKAELSNNCEVYIKIEEEEIKEEYIEDTQEKLKMEDFDEGDEGEQPPPKKGKGKNAGGQKKVCWSLPDVTEEDLVEWLKNNTYLWLRSTKDYHKKKAAWEEKAKELNISLQHLQNWWKNVKDWYVKLVKKTSGQASKPLTGRDKWVLANISFYKSQMPNDVPDTLNTLPRSGYTSSSAAAASTSQPLDYDSEGNILEEIELEEAQQAKKVRSKRRATADDPEDDWTVELRTTMKSNQALLERLLVDRPQPQSRREAFIRYVSDVLRTVPDDEYQVLQDKISLTLNERCMGPSTFSQQPTLFPNPSTSSWQQYGVIVDQQQQQFQSQSLKTPVRSRDSAESIGRVLASNIGEDWNMPRRPLEDI